MRKPFRGARKPLRQLVLERLQKAPVTMDDLLQAFPAYSIVTMRTVIPQLRAAGHNIGSCPVKHNRSGTLNYEYKLLPRKPIEIR